MKIREAAVWPLVALVRLYQRIISPAIAPRCKYAPTCSNYALEALKIHGPVKGSILAGWRLLRCNPWSNGGVDYVPARGHWRAPRWQPPSDWVGNLEPYTLTRPLPMGLDARWQSDVYRPMPTVKVGDAQTAHHASLGAAVDVQNWAETPNRGAGLVHENVPADAGKAQGASAPSTL